jgi:hypothetical protein
MFSATYIFGTFVENQIVVAVGLISGSSIPLVYVSIFVSIPL